MVPNTKSRKYIKKLLGSEHKRNNIKISYDSEHKNWNSIKKLLGSELKTVTISK